MRVAGRGPRDPQARRLSAESKQQPVGKDQRRFERFKAHFKANAPKHEWRNFRCLATAVFGERALLDRRLAGENHRRLALSQAQLRALAAHPDKVKAKLQTLEREGIVPVEGSSRELKAGARAELYSKLIRQSLPAGGERPPKATGTGASSSESVSFTVATVNDDFTDRQTNLPGVKADVMLVQEAKNTNIDRVMSDSFGVHQNTGREDKAGSAVVWDKERVKAGQRGYELGVDPGGAAMLKRWISWTDVKVDGVKVRMVSVHRPPQRFAHLWPRFDANLAAFVRKHQGPMVIGMDANQREPRGLERATGLKWSAPKGSIDGFLVSAGIEVERIKRLPKRTSDHHPVVATLRIDRKRALAGEAAR